jgi:hypothetical protein
MLADHNNNNHYDYHYPVLELRLPTTAQDIRAPESFLTRLSEILK